MYVSCMRIFLYEYSKNIFLLPYCFIKMFYKSFQRYENIYCLELIISKCYIMKFINLQWYIYFYSIHIFIIKQKWTNFISFFLPCIFSSLNFFYIFMRIYFPFVFLKCCLFPIFLIFFFPPALEEFFFLFFFLFPFFSYFMVLFSTFIFRFPLFSFLFFSSVALSL